MVGYSHPEVTQKIFLYIYLQWYGDPRFMEAIDNAIEELDPFLWIFRIRFAH